MTRDERASALLELVRLLHESGFRIDPKHRKRGWAMALKRWRQEIMKGTDNG